MSKALVIKNADFSANKVTTITFDEEVPCTGVAFNSATVTVTSLGTASIGYTLTPANTTDTVTLTSSDSTVVSVSGTTITAVGIGTATLTLTCGSYSATCTVTVSIEEEFVHVAAWMSDTTDGSNNTGLYFSETSRRLVLAKNLSDTDFTTAIHQDLSISYGDIAPCQIPENATKLHIEARNMYSGNNYVYFFNGTDTTFVSGMNTYTQILSSATLSVSSGTINTDVTIPEGANGYLVAFRQAVTYNSIFSDCTTEAEVKSLADETFAPSVTYLTA